MGLKFLNKKGWHTGSLRNIENVWKAEQKHAAEDKKLDELRKQIVEERERSEFRELQEKAGLVPRQERLEFLYDSGLAVGRPGGSDNLKEAFTKVEEPSSSAAAVKEASSSAPGALFAAEKPQSANDAWRKLHSDPLLMIKQREQEALARIKNNPVQMAIIRKQVEAKKPKEKEHDKKEHRKKHRKSSSKHQHMSDLEDDKADMERRKSRHHKTSKYVKHSESEDESHEKAHRTEKNHVKQSNVEDESRYRARDNGKSQAKYSDSEDELRNKTHNRVRHSDLEDASRTRGRRSERNRGKHSDSEDELHNRRSQNQKNPGRHSDSEDELHSRRSRSEKNRSKHSDSEDEMHDRRIRSDENRVKHSESVDGLHNRVRRSEKDHAVTRGKTDGQDVVKGKHENSEQENFSMRGRNESHNRRRFVPPKLSEEERAARLKEMQMDAELHEEQRWKRLKKADENDAWEATTQANRPGGKNFLDAVQTSVYGSGKGGSSTIEESVRRRTHYSQGRSEGGESNAFRR